MARYLSLALLRSYTYQTLRLQQIIIFIIDLFKKKIQPSDLSISINFNTLKPIFTLFH